MRPLLARLRTEMGYRASVGAVELGELFGEAADRIEALEAELARCHYFLRVIAGHAEDISTEATCALRPAEGPSDD